MDAAIYVKKKIYKETKHRSIFYQQEPKPRKCLLNHNV